MATTLLFRRGDTATSNAFTGTEGELFVDTQKDTVVVHDGTTQGGHPLATETYVDTQITTLIDSAPGTLDTLNELAAALGDDANFATTVTNSIATKLAIADFDSTADAYLTGGTGITYTSGTIAIDPTANVTLDELTVSSTTYSFGGTNMAEMFGVATNTTSTAAVNVGSYLVSISRSAKVFIQAFDNDANEVHVSELLVTFDGTTAHATEYATIYSGSNVLFTTNVQYDSLAAAVEVIATPASTNDIDFKVLIMALGA